MKKSLVLSQKEELRKPLISYLETKGFCVLTPSIEELDELVLEETQNYLIFLSPFFEKSIPSFSQHIFLALGDLEHFENPDIFYAEIKEKFSEKELDSHLKNINLFMLTKTKNQALLDQKKKSLTLIGQSEFIKSFKERILSIGRSRTCLLRGERGVGFQHLAQEVHNHSPYVYASFEVFHKKQPLETHLSSSSGTLFIPQVDELSRSEQTQLLSFLKTKKTKNIIASCYGENLDSKIQVGEFLRELYDEFLISFKIPALSERPEDIPLLARHFLEELSASFQTFKQFSPEVLSFFKQKHWPDNVVGLKKAVGKAFFQSQSETILLKDFSSSTSFESDVTFRKARDLFEKEFILKALEFNQGHVTKTAQDIGLERSYLHRKLKSYGVDN